MCCYPEQDLVVNLAIVLVGLLMTPDEVLLKHYDENWRLLLPRWDRIFSGLGPYTIFHYCLDGDLKLMVGVSRRVQPRIFDIATIGFCGDHLKVTPHSQLMVSPIKRFMYNDPKMGDKLQAMCQAQVRLVKKQLRHKVMGYYYFLTCVSMAGFILWWLIVRSHIAAQHIGV
jgi:hypothetical protein